MKTTHYYITDKAIITSVSDKEKAVMKDILEKALLDMFQKGVDKKSEKS